MATTTSPFNLAEYFVGDDCLARIGEQTAIEFRGREVSYNGLRSQVEYWARRLDDRGVENGDRVALLLYDSPHLIASFLGAGYLGAVAVPINTFLAPEDIAFIIADSGAKLVLAERVLADKLAAEQTAPSTAIIVVDDDYDAKPSNGVPLAATTKASPAFLLYTSGSTGTPKGVLHLHGSMRATVETYAQAILRLTESDRVFSASRLFFAYGLGNSLSFPLAAGATVILEAERPSPSHVARILANNRPTVFFGVPALYRALLDLKAKGETFDASSVRMWVSAGEALPAAIFNEWLREVEQPILDGIGSTEMLHIFISNTPDDARAGSSGRPVPGYSVKLTDDAGNELSGEATGNLWVRGDSATAGYWGRPDLTADTIRDGWVRTGDVYTRDAGGYYSHVGRSDDCFKVQGLWVSPIEVESALLSHPSVMEAAVVEATDASGLATAHAFAVIRPGSDRPALAAELREHVASQLPRFKVPSQFEFIDSLPRTSTGKIQRYKLRRPRRVGGIEGEK
ncbi:MAG TPA: benzoate-CoA ligase family protein [Blastocatellia bacterium]|nr:benzoate-CoA ligase family protein [Blastocatellia bacterium]